MKLVDLVVFLTLSCVILLGVSSCSLNPKITLPADVLVVNPAEACSSFSRPDAWNLKAILVESGEKTYLVVYFDPPFDVFHQPWVELTTLGQAIYDGREGDLYYYRLGKLSASSRIGKISFLIRSRLDVMGEMKDDTVTFSMERRSGTNCVVFI